MTVLRIREKIMLNINKKIENGKAAFNLEGRLDMITAPMLEEQLLASLDGVTELILDFKDLTYISSAGIRVLLTAQEALGQQGEMKLIQVNEMIRGILEMTGITNLMPVE